jgi:hypothetical protein
MKLWQKEEVEAQHAEDRSQQRRHAAPNMATNRTKRRKNETYSRRIDLAPKRYQPNRYQSNTKNRE